VFFTNGASQRVNAGQGIAIGVGGELAIPGVESLRLRSTVEFNPQFMYRDKTESPWYEPWAFCFTSSYAKA
jgi:hypothetical protein